MAQLLNMLLSLSLSLCLFASPAFATRETNSYDGNIFPLYAGNGSLVPPSTTLSEALNKKRTSAIIYYLDDSFTSKAFAPVVSALKLIWGPSIDLIPLTTDEMQGRQSEDPRKESYYWRGHVPQIVVINGQGEVMLDKEGQVPLEEINEAISKGAGIMTPDYKIEIKSYNEFNSEAAKEGYLTPRK